MVELQLLWVGVTLVCCITVHCAGHVGRCDHNRQRSASRCWLRNHCHGWCESECWRYIHYCGLRVHRWFVVCDAGCSHCSHNSGRLLFRNIVHGQHDCGSHPCKRRLQRNDADGWYKCTVSSEKHGCCYGLQRSTGCLHRSDVWWWPFRVVGWPGCWHGICGCSWR